VCHLTGLTFTLYFILILLKIGHVTGCFSGKFQLLFTVFLVFCFNVSCKCFSINPSGHFGDVCVRFEEFLLKC